MKVKKFQIENILMNENKVSLKLRRQSNPQIKIINLI